METRYQKDDRANEQWIAPVGVNYPLRAGQPNPTSRTVCRLGFVRFVLVGLLLQLLGSCSSKCQIAGQVSDGFGRPLCGATIAIANTTFSTKTDDNGRYAVQYVPGQVTMIFNKEGCTTVQRTLSIATETEYPSELVVLYEMPDEKGIVALGIAEYVSLQKGSLQVQSVNLSPTVQQAVMEDFYCVSETATEPFDFSGPVLPEGNLTFLDNDGSGQRIFAVTSFGLPNEPRARKIVLRRKKNLIGTKDVTQIIPDESVKVAPGVWIRKVTLPKGLYAFVTERQGGQVGSGLPSFLTPIMEPVYTFKVQ